ncbi:oxidoreductase, FAD-binding protein [Dactylonectria macrodidyma]|uniref:Oxidoreductase, FAD-binding protein n=1 Tax=Dactylonectria macrodidyma TaxID=307937 RepID=A0A9P9FMQ6_9HYPO|nr:oxidoreductase, FAD-binding protein [Dactylonectria macrodidyma]
MSTESQRYVTRAEYPSKVLVRGTSEYERCRQNNPSADTPSRYPREIHVVETPEDVSVALKRATELGVHVGVRSSGHIFNLPNLIEGGILIDTTNLNRQIDYDPISEEICFGPACRVEELAAKLKDIDRFFPHGHAPTVGSGGFLLAGGQGWFVRGWGATNQTWINKIEMVVPDGRTVIASRTENRDLFWAARGSGLGFFGVITRFWGRTIKTSLMWERILKFEINSDNYMALMSWAIERGRDTPKYGTDLNLTIDYPEKYDPSYTTDAIPVNGKLNMTLNLLCYTDTVREARTLLSAYDKITPEVQAALLELHPVQRRTVEQVFARKRRFLGNDKKDRWQINSIMNDPDVPLERLLEAIKPAMLELPTRTSSVFMCHCDIVPDEEDAALSLPQDLYISTITGWTDPKLEPAIYQPMRDRYRRAFPVAVGMYITELDVNCDDANTKVLSDTALAKFLKIREKWDPKELFPNYKKFVKAHDKINRLQNKAQL